MSPQDHKPARPSLLDLDVVRSHFPALGSDTVFMDNAGGSQILGSVVDRIRDYLLTSNVQLGASYAVSALASERRHDSQVRVAEFLNAGRADEIVMGPSTTMLVQTLARAMAPNLAPGDEVIVSRADHESNIGPWVGLEARGVVVKFWDLDLETMALELGTLEGLLSPRTRLVAVTHSSNILGAVVPVAEVARLAHAHGARVCVDGVAWAPHRAVDVRALDVDYYVCSFYKVYGPHHAVLYGRHANLVELANQYHYFVAKDQVPYKLQPGNPNYELSYGVAGIPDYFVDLGERLGATTDVPSETGSRRSHIECAFEAIARHEAALAERLLAFLRDRPGVRIIGPDSSDPTVRVPTISFVVDGQDSGAIVRRIDRLGIGIRFGDFHSRRLIEHLDLTRTSGVVRVSMVHYNTLEEVDRLVAGLGEALSA